MHLCVASMRCSAPWLARVGHARRGLASGAHEGKVLVIAGPTGVGKTNLSLALARTLHGEIISADSAQVFRGLSIGTDKVTLDQQRLVPHANLDVFDFDGQTSSAHTFAGVAMDAIDDMLARGKTPIVVGGAGFLLQW